jgi:hypothetical protein
MQFFTMFPIRFYYNKACNWSIGFFQIVNISKLHHMLESNHSTFYVRSYQVSFLYRFLVLKIRTLLFTQNVQKMVTFHCLPSSRCCPGNPLAMEIYHRTLPRDVAMEVYHQILPWESGIDPYYKDLHLDIAIRLSYKIEL